MKITYIVGVFPKLSETFILSQITGLIDRGHEVDIVSLTRPDEAQVHRDVLNYNLLSRTQYVTRNSSSLGFEIDARLLTSLVFNDLLHSHFAAQPTELALKISRLLSIPFIFTAHAYDIFIDPNPALLRERATHADRVVTVSEYNKRYLTDLLGPDLGAKIDIIRYGIDVKKFKMVERKPGPQVKFLFVGRFIEKKGLDYLLQAFALALQKAPEARLRIIGDGPLREEVSAKVGQLGLGDAVTLLGGQPQEAVVAEMHDADVFVLPSITASNGDREGVPLVLMEAQATGLPVISTLHTGIPEEVTDGVSGFLVPERDVQAMADRMVQVAADDALRKNMGKAGRKMIESKYNRENELDSLETLMRNLTKGKTSVSALPLAQRQIIEQRIRDGVTQAAHVRADQMKRIDEIVKLVGDVKLKDAQLQQKTAELQQKSAMVEDLKKKVDAAEQSVKELNSALQSTRAEVLRLQQTLQETEDRLQTSLRQKESSLLQREREISSLTAEVKRQTNEVIFYKSWVDNIHNTFAYKVYALVAKPFAKLFKH